MKKDGNHKTKTKKVYIVMVAYLLLFTLLMGIYVGYIYTYNHTDRFFYVGDENDAFTVSIGPRTGKTDSWVKNVEENGDTIPYYGTIYDVTLDNTGDYTISQWSMKLQIPRPCYLNNAWCGTFDVHQNVGDNKLVQNVDLRDYDLGDLILNYRSEDQDLMIPLAQGDYLIYRPDLAANEYPISSGTNLKMAQVVFGMIFYTNDSDKLEFEDYTITYRLQKNITQSEIFWVLIAAFCIWLILVIILTTLAINTKQAHRRFVQDEHIIHQSIGVFTQFFEAKDTYTNGHSQRVASYSRMIAEHMGFSDDECRQIYYIALMHDCGKCYIPDEILKKPGRLTEEEYEVIKSHTVKGAEMLENFNSIEHIREGVLYHHERYDGKGYPEGLAGNGIPIISRIICISDSFDAMNSKRCYRDTLTKEYILNELKNNSGKQFDPKLVEIFMKLIEEGLIIVG